MASSVEEKDFVDGRRSGEFGMRPEPLDANDKMNRKMARQILWDALKEFKMKGGKIFLVDPGFHDYSCISWCQN